LTAILQIKALHSLSSVAEMHHGTVPQCVENAAKSMGDLGTIIAEAHSLKQNTAIFNR
jgi:hypothetical protein